MNRLRIASFTLFILSGLALYTLSATPASARQPSQAGAAPAASHAAKVMREFRGVKLGLKTEAVHTALGKPESTGDNREEYIIGGDDRLTVHYENGAVKAIQLYFANPKNAPAWAEVVGDAEIKQTESGAKHARVIVNEEKFWVSMFQSKDSTVTTITIQSTGTP